MDHGMPPSEPRKIGPIAARGTRADIQMRHATNPSPATRCQTRITPSSRRGICEWPARSGYQDEQIGGKSNAFIDNKKADETFILLFGRRGAAYKNLIDKIIPRTVTYYHQFISDDVFEAWVNSDRFDVSECNQILASELIDKAHLAANTALFRSKQWMDAACLSYMGDNFVGWASAIRGLTENAGDILDGLMNIGPALADNKIIIRAALLRRHHDHRIDFSQIDMTLDHYVLAKWMRAPKGDVLKAKDNIEYVRMLECGKVPRIVEFYQRLCGITHPSSLSINYAFETTDSGTRLRFDQERENIDKLIGEFPNILESLVAFSFNAPLIILRVLHIFKRHPKIPELRNLNWHEIPAWKSVEESLKRDRY